MNKAEWDQISAQYTVSLIWEKMTWRGVPCWQAPSDLLVFQEIIFQTKPDLIIETGTKFGGTALFFRDMLELCLPFETTKVISVDIDHTPAKKTKEIEAWNRQGVVLIEGDSKSNKILEMIRKESTGFSKVMVVLDSDHTYEHVVLEMESLASLVTPGMYLVCMDTILEEVGKIDGFSDFRKSNPAIACREFLTKHPEFEIDKSREYLGMTFARNGFLRRKF